MNTKEQNTMEELKRTVTLKIGERLGPTKYQYRTITTDRAKLQGDSDIYDCVKYPLWGAYDEESYKGIDMKPINDAMAQLEVELNQRLMDEIYSYVTDEFDRIKAHCDDLKQAMSDEMYEKKLAMIKQAKHSNEHQV